VMYPYQGGCGGCGGAALGGVWVGVGCVRLGWLRVLAGQARGVGCAWAGLVGEDWLVERLLFVLGVCGWLCVGCAQWLRWGCVNIFPVYLWEVGLRTLRKKPTP
jgi:hypothetical protein